MTQRAENRLTWEERVEDIRLVMNELLRDQKFYDARRMGTKLYAIMCIYSSAVEKLNLEWKEGK